MTEPARALRQPASAGFTLVELMIALIVISIGIIALSGVQTRSSRDVYATGRRTEALAMAEDRIEQIRGAGYTLAASDSGASGVFNWNSQVDSVGPGLKSIDVTINWREQAQSQSVDLRTLLSSR